jgi:hypothetical protein
MANIFAVVLVGISYVLAGLALVFVVVVWVNGRIRSEGKYVINDCCTLCALLCWLLGIPCGVAAFFVGHVATLFGTAALALHGLSLMAYLAFCAWTSRLERRCRLLKDD